MNGSSHFTKQLAPQDPVLQAVVRLLVESDPCKPGSFTARLDSSAAILARSHQPLVDGARALLERGFDPVTPLTMRHAGKGHDSFKPAPIGELAKMTYTEGERTPLHRQRWKPREMPVAASTGDQKSPSEVGPAQSGHSWSNALYGRPAHRQSAMPSLRRARGQP